MYCRPGFDCKVLLNANCKFSKNSQSTNRKIEDNAVFPMTRDHKTQSFDSRSSSMKYFAIVEVCNRNQAYGNMLIHTCISTFCLST